MPCLWVSRRGFVARLAALGTAFNPSTATRAQRPRVRRIGAVIGDDPEGGFAAFKERLRQLGHVEGENLHIELRETLRAAGGTNPAAELVRTNLELVLIHSLPSALAARAANPGMWLVVVTTPGFVTNGFANSLERPGGNITGIDELPPNVTATRLDLLKTAAPAVARIALLSTTPGTGGHETQLADAEEAARRHGVAVKPYRAASVAELDAALAAIAADGMNGLVNFQGGLSYINRRRIVDFAANHRIPAIYQASVFATAGGLMSWAPDLVDQFRIAAGLVDQILRGANPGDLPIRYPARYYLTLNNTAARTLQIAFPQALLSKADRLLP